MKIDASLYHLVLFVACLIFLAVIIVTGHDSSPLLQQLGGGLFGGVLGGSGVGAVPAIARFINGPQSPPANGPTAQRGRVHPLALVLILGASLAITACASLGSPLTTSTSNPIATACAGSSAALKVITAARQANILTPADVLAVNSALTVVTPICGAAVEPTPTAAVTAALGAAVVDLQTIATHYPTTATGT
jgi:hypothetical protein